MEEVIEMAKSESAIERIKKLDAEREKILSEAREEAMARVTEALTDLNSLGENYRLTNSAAPRGTKKGSTVEARYHNPSNPSQRWAGRGMKPLWLKELLEKGKKIEDFEIRK